MIVSGAVVDTAGRVAVRLLKPLTQGRQAHAVGAVVWLLPRQAESLIATHGAEAHVPKATRRRRSTLTQPQGD